MIHYTQIIWEEVAFSWKVTGKTVAISIAPTVLYMLYQYHYTLSPREAEELLWCRFINVTGAPGRNIAADLHMECLKRFRMPANRQKHHLCRKNRGYTCSYLKSL